MNLLDMRTVLLGYSVTTVICLVVVAALWFRYRRRFDGLAFWLAHYALQFVSLLMALTRGFAPEGLAIATSPPALAIGMILFYIGLERFTRKRGPQIHKWTLVAVYLLAQGYFGFISPSLTARNILLSGFIAVLCSQCAWLLLRRVGPAMRPITRGTGYALVAISVLNAVRIVVNAVSPVGQDFLQSPDRDTVFMFLFQFLSIILVFALALMVSRLLMESDRGRRDEAERLARLRLSLFEFGPSHPMKALVELALDEVEKLTGSLVSFYHLVDEGQGTLTLMARSARTREGPGAAEGEDRSYPIAEAGVWAEAVRERRPVVLNDGLSPADRKALFPGHASLVRELVVPTVREGRAVAVLGVGNKATDYDESDIEHVSYVADVVWGILAERMAQEEIGRLNADLERKVEERTGELGAARVALEAQLRETHEAHRAKGESEERFRGIFDNAPVGIFATGGDGRILLANRALAGMLGADIPTQIYGLNLCRDLCRVGEGYGVCLPRWVSEARPYLHEVEWRRLDGAPLWVRVRVKPASQPRGEIRYEGTVEDITAIRSAQERLRTLETAIEAMDLGFCITDAESRILYANPAEARMHGYTVEGILGMRAQDLGPESQRHERTLSAVKEPLVFRREGLNRRADGTLFPAFLTSLPVYDAGGAPFCVITTCHDLTESKRRDSQLQEALRDAVVGKLAAVVAHQVNTPLAAMKTRLEMLREDAGEDEATRRSLDVVMKQVDKVAQTIRSLLGFVRQRSVGQEFTSIQGVIASVTRLFEGALQSKGIRLDVTQPTAPLRVQGSAADLQEVFLNLFENYREALGRDNRITVSVRARTGSVEVRLEDDGPGLGNDPERVFEPFYTTKSHGTGLGLPICRNICTACGGALTAENRSPEDGGGARFIITLPLTEWERPPKEGP